MILLLLHRRSIIVKKAKRAKGQKQPPKHIAPATREALLFNKPYSNMVPRLRSQNKERSNRPKRSSCHLKMVGKVIRLAAPLRPPTIDGDKNGTADDANIVFQTTTSSPSSSHHHNHRCRRMPTPATTKVPNGKEILPPALNNNYNNNNDDATTTTTIRQRHK